MPPVGIQSFINYSGGAAQSVSLANAGNALRAVTGSLGERVSLFFTRATTIQAQNQAVRQEFANALTTQYGAAVANRVFTPAHVNQTPLSAREVRTALGQAALENHRNTALAGQPPIGAFATQKLEARETSFLRNNAGPLQANVMTGQVATQIVNAYQASGAMALDQEATRMAASAALGTAADVQATAVVNHAVANMATPNAARQPMYEAFLRTALANMAPRAMAADPRPNCPLLTQLAGKLAESLDNHIGMMMSTQIMAHPNHDALALQLAADPVALFAQNPSMLQALDTEMVAFTRNIDDMLQRVQADIAGIENTFFAGAAAGDVTGIHVTGSDPHHGGQRVMIMTFANFPNDPVVYKPRDCRVDACIAGEGGAGGVPGSLADIVNNAVGANTIPTYRYMLGGLNGDEYGFVQHLSHQAADFDCGANAALAGNYFRDMGRQAAVAYLCGVTDLHQGNFIVSGGRPHMTDLEIAFSRSVLDRTGALPSVGATGLDRALTSVDENEFRLPFMVGGGGAFVPQHNVAPSATANFVNFNGHPARLDDPIHGAAFQAEAQTGFDEVLDALAANPANGQLTTLLHNHFGGMNVRYHPITTLSQLQTLEVRKLNSDLAPDRAVAGNLTVGDVDQRYALGDVQHRFDAVARQDFAIGDVAYFTRQLGNAQDVFHHDRNGAAVVPDVGHVFGYDGLGDALARIADIHNNPATVLAMKASMANLVG